MRDVKESLIDVAVDERRLAHAGDGKRYLCPKQELPWDCIISALFSLLMVGKSAVWLAVCMRIQVSRMKRTPKTKLV